MGLRLRQVSSTDTSCYWCSAEEPITAPAYITLFRSKTTSGTRHVAGFAFPDRTDWRALKPSERADLFFIFFLLQQWRRTVSLALSLSRQRERERERQHSRRATITPLAAMFLSRQPRKLTGRWMEAVRRALYTSPIYVRLSSRDRALAPITTRREWSRGVKGKAR